MFNLTRNHEYANQSNSEIPFIAHQISHKKKKIYDVKVQINWRIHALI